MVPLTCERTGRVGASGSRANARPMTGSAKQSGAAADWIASRLAPRNDRSAQLLKRRPGSWQLAHGCEGLHDLVDAGFEPGDLQRLLEKRKGERVLAHRVVTIDALPLRVHRDPCAVLAAMEAGRNKARRPADRNLCGFR